MDSTKNSLVNSLFEESKLEDYDNETLGDVIRSLEAEIAPVIQVDDHISQAKEASGSFQEDCMLNELMEQMNGCSPSQDWDFSCLDSTNNWTLEDIEYMMMVDGVNEYEGVGEYSLSCSSISFDEDENYSSLWHCSDEVMIYE